LGFFLGFGASETVFWGLLISGSVLGGGMMTTSSIGAVLTAFWVTATGLAGALDTAAVAGAVDGGPDNETRLTRIDPGENLGFGPDAGQNTTDPMNIKWITRDIPKYSTMVRDTAPAAIGYACTYDFLFISL
jgi:hypothetical protein